MKKKPIVAIMYDFDKTLSTTDMQNYGFIPALGMTPDQFWGATGEFSKKTGVERILSYMYMMIALSREKGVELTRKALNKMGEGIKFFPGVEGWFKRINAYGKKKGVIVEHYLISSGTKEIIEGCSIYKEFKNVYGCEFYFDEKTGLPVWPKLAVNYTQKTQYFFRISKGALDVTDDSKVNTKGIEHRVPYTNMIYLGDGMTDVPCMQLVKDNGGKSIAIFSRGDKDTIRTLLRGGRVNYASLANYNEGSQLDVIIKAVIDNVSTSNVLRVEEEKIFKREVGKK